MSLNTIFRKSTLPVSSIDGLGQAVQVCPNLWIEYVSLGSNLILLNHAGGDRGRGTNLSTITEKCGILFNNDEILDPYSNLGVDAYPLISNFVKHPILSDIENICFRIGCSLIITNNAIPLAFTEDSTGPPKKAILGLGTYGKGYVFVSGSYEIFKDNVKGGINYSNNAKLILNLLNWFGSMKKTDKKKSPQSNKTQDLTNYISIPPKNPPKISENHPFLKKLDNEFKKITIEINKLKDEHKTVLTENNELKEKIRIFEMNIAEFPDQNLSELNIEVENNISKIKIHSKLIFKLEHEIALLRKDITKIGKKIEPFLNQIKTLNPEINKKTFYKPIITTNANLINQEEKSQSPNVSARINACEQLLQLLDTNYKRGLLTQEEYQQKRLKFEKKLSELQ
ncbi:MAG: hypothetical protein ACFFD2_16245 [Promethearchaeota archaeon]